MIIQSGPPQSFCRTDGGHNFVLVNMRMKLLVLLFISVCLFVTSAFAQTGSLSGVVSSRINGELIPGVTVEIKQLRLNAVTDANGRYSFPSVPPGTYTVLTHIEGFADLARTVRVANEPVTLDLKLSLQSISAEVTVTATGEEQSVYESFSSVSSIDTTRITEQASTSVGQVLENEAGVSVRSFGGGASGRPSIRGFEGDRVLILQDGVRNGSIGSASGDHGEPISPLNLERLEVIKGPATLLYGSNAIGGVVNAVTDDEDHPHPGFRGYFSTFGGSVNRQLGIAGGLDYGFGNSIAELNFNSSREGDFSTPLGRIPNSASRAQGGAGGYGYFGDKAFIRGTITVDRRRYGIPYAPLFESGEILSIINGNIDCTLDPPPPGQAPCEYDVDEIKRIFANQLPPVPDEEIDIDMKRNNYRVVTGFRDLNGAVTSGTFSFDFTDYQHQEIEIENSTETVATTFENDTFSYRAMFRQQKYKRLSGQFGFEGFRRSFLTTGDEALIEGRVRNTNFAFYGLEEVSVGKLALQFGGRIESNRYKPVNPALPVRTFTGFSGSVGAKYEVWEGGSLIASFSSSYRPPALEELYNFGPHIGTVTFETGDPDLSHERSIGYEFSFRQNSERVRFNGSFFHNDIHDFIILVPQDADNDGKIDVMDLLPVGIYLQEDASYTGADASLEVDVHKYVGTFVVADIVKAELKNRGFSPPRITPARVRAGVEFRYKGLSIRPEAVFVGARKDGDIFPLETSTDSYRLFNINSSFAVVAGKTAHIFTLGGQNLGNSLYRNHTNFLKDMTPGSGRGFKATYTVRIF